MKYIFMKEYNAITDACLEQYVNEFEQLLLLNFQQIYLNVQRTLPSEGYHAWHSEHGIGRTQPWRVLSFLICLSDNDSYTEFRRHRNVRTKAGRGIIFPAYHTHEHRGSVCKKGLDRYMFGGYFSFLPNGES